MKKKVGVLSVINIMVLFLLSSTAYAAIKTGSYGVLPPRSMYTVCESKVLTMRSVEGEWIQTSSGAWKYKFSDGTYATNEWVEVDSRWYHFDAYGIILSLTVKK